MPNYVRWGSKGASYFFTVVSYRRRRIFDHAHARSILQRAMVTVRRKHPFEMFACVLLPDHLHCLWTLPENDDDFPIRWANLKKLFTRGWVATGDDALPVTANRAQHGERGVWQPRYWEHRIRDETDWYRHRDYIHLNPVKHEYVKLPEEWPWSSFHRHVRLGWLDPKWPGSSPVAVLDVQGDD